VAILTQPFMPQASARILDQLAVAGDRRAFDALTDADALVGGTPLPAPQGVFPRHIEAEAAG
jgi:methionyl-tRNA synthetase